MTRQIVERTQAGHIVTADIEHVARVILAIQQRRLSEIEVTFAPAEIVQTAAVIPLKRKSS